MWEELKEKFEGRAESARLKVPDGWLVRTIVKCYENIEVCMIFVSDPNHDWEL